MSGKVFVSCGQRPPREKKIADKVGKLLKSRFGLESYLAFAIQGLNDIMKITEELKSSDYYLFIDFARKDEHDLPCSLFTHQELALAHHLGFSEIIAFQEKDVPLEGFLKYVQANPESFTSEEELLDKVEKLVKDRKWSKDYSRNLVVPDIRQVGPIQYGDHTGTYFGYVWHARIENRRPDVAAVNTVCILDSIQDPSNQKTSSSDRSYLKWAGQKGYERTILPKDFGTIDVFAIHADKRGVFLHSAQDVIPREPIIDGDGRYVLFYKVFSQGFPLLEFSIRIDYRWAPPTPAQWKPPATIEFPEKAQCA